MTGVVEMIFEIHIVEIIPSKLRQTTENMENESLTAASKEILQYFSGGGDQLRGRETCNFFPHACL